MSPTECDAGTLPTAKVVSLVTSSATTSECDPIVIQRVLKNAGVSIQMAIGCIKLHLEERIPALLGSNGNKQRTTNEQRDNLKLLGRVLGTLAKQGGDVDPVASLLSSLRVCHIAASLLADNRTVELHFFIGQLLCAICSPLQGELYDCSGTRSDLYDFYTETSLRIAHPTQVALLDLLLILYDETDAPALLSCAAPGNGWVSTGNQTARLPLTTPRPPPRSTPLLFDMPEPELPEGSEAQGGVPAKMVNNDGQKKHALLRNFMGKFTSFKPQRAVAIL